MTQIKTTSFHNLRNNEHFQFMTDVKKLILQLTPPVLGLENLFPQFSTAYEVEDQTLRVVQGSLKTEIMTVLDGNRDRIWSGTRNKTIATLDSPFEDEVSSAKAVLQLIELYGNIRKFAYSEESAAISNLVGDLQTPEMVIHTDKVGVTSWINELKEVNDQFQAVSNERDTEFVNRESGDTRSARIAIDAVYEEIVKRINAMLVLEVGGPEVDEFAREVNRKIEYYETVLAMRQGRKDEALN